MHLPGPESDAQDAAVRARLAQLAPQAPVERIETHMSWVFMAGDHVLKRKKPVRYPFLDFSTVAAREAYCREELRLNRRLAPDVYLGLMVLQSGAGQPSLLPEDQAEPSAPVLDWLVWMRRLPRERMLDSLLAEHAVTVPEIDGLAALLAAFYRSAPHPATDPDEYLLRFERERAASAEVLLRPQFQLAGAAEALDGLETALRRQRDALRERVAQHRIVDGHGDLRPEHVCLQQPPVVIDALEFNARLRRVDPFEELAFLGLECELAGAAWIGPRLVDACAAALDDRPPPALLHLYRADRALLRGRLAMAHLLDPQPRTPTRWTPLAQRHIDVALAALR